MRRGRAILLVALVAVFVALVARAEDVVLDVPAGVTCAVPGLDLPVTLPVGVLVPASLWTRLDEAMKKLEREAVEARAREVEKERQFDAIFAPAVSVSAGVGVVLGVALVLLSGAR